MWRSTAGECEQYVELWVQKKRLEWRVEKLVDLRVPKRPHSQEYEQFSAKTIGKKPARARPHRPDPRPHGSDRSGPRLHPETASKTKLKTMYKTTVQAPNLHDVTGQKSCQFPKKTSNFKTLAQNSGNIQDGHFQNSGNIRRGHFHILGRSSGEKSGYIRDVCGARRDTRQCMPLKAVSSRSQFTTKIGSLWSSVTRIHKTQQSSWIHAGWS